MNSGVILEGSSKAEHDSWTLYNGPIRLDLRSQLRNGKITNQPACIGVTGWDKGSGRCAFETQPSAVADEGDY